MKLSEHQRSVLIGGARAVDGLVRTGDRTLAVLVRAGLVDDPQYGTGGAQARGRITDAGRRAVAA